MAFLFVSLNYTNGVVFPLFASFAKIPERYISNVSLFDI